MGERKGEGGELVVGSVVVEGSLVSILGGRRWEERERVE